MEAHHASFDRSQPSRGGSPRAQSARGQERQQHRSAAYRGDDGEWVEKAIWNRVPVFGKQRDRAAKLNTGDQIYVEGEIGRTSYTKDNDRVFVTNLKVFRFGVLSRK
nr:single-stranded DNA-binding protein [Altericroceibacterium spongiae]